MKTKKLLMMCLLVVAVICACTVRVNALEYQESTATIFDEGGDYSLYYILNNFNHFVETNAKAGHTIGAVAVGGDASYINGNGKQDYTQTTSSYLKGNINAIISDGFFKNLYVGEINRERTYSHQNDEHTFISKDDSYINFDEAFDSIQAEASSYVGTGDCKITEFDLNKTNSTLDGNHWKLERLKKYEGPDEFILTVDAGYSYEFGEGVISKLTGVNLMYSDGITSQTDTMFISNDTGSVSMPYIYLNGQFDAITNMGLVGSHEWGEGLSVVTVLPRATEAIDKDSNQVHIGHVVAPNADVHNMNGDINGCIVSKSLDVSNGESHMWPYSGYRIKRNSSQPSKPSNPVQPGGSQGEDKKPEENNPGTGSSETPNNPTQGENKGDNIPNTGNNDSSNNQQSGNATNPQPGQNDNNGNTSNENSNTGTETPDPKSNNDTNNSSTNNKIILNKEELTTNISRKQNTPKISSNKNSKVIVENNKQTKGKQKDSVKTGDDAHLLMYVLLELLAFVGIVSLRKKA